MITGPYPTFRALRPEQTFMEFEGSTITIPLTGQKDGREYNEDIQLRAFMRLELDPPYLNNKGTREFQFTIRDWDLYGTCPMLNKLFFDDPRGKFFVNQATGRADYIPAMMTLNVSNHYYDVFDGIRLPGGGGLPIPGPIKDPILGDPRNIEMNYLNSHAFRVWDTVSGKDGDEWVYSNPNNKIYFEIMPIRRLVDPLASQPILPSILSGVTRAGNDAPVIVFHKKPPGLTGQGAFDITKPEDRAKYLLAISDFSEIDKRPTTRGELSVMGASLPDRGEALNITRFFSNTPLFSNNREADPLEIRWMVPPDIGGPSAVGGLMSSALSAANADKITGYIQVVSPARSICTALQGPDLGRPIDSADFPANIHYSINFNVFVNEHRMIQDAAGVAHAYGIHRIPPRDVTVAFDKTHAGIVLERNLKLGKGHCTGMHTITREEFREGRNFARYWRKMPLTFDPNKNYDYDPKINY
jgi:hypothetical protein